MRAALAAILAAVMGLSIACSSGGGAAENSTPVPPPLALPPLDPRLQSLGDGELELHITSGTRQRIDPLKLAAAFGTPPTCADFVFLFSWRTQDDRSIRFVGNRQGGEFDIQAGPTGQASVSGCIALEAVNDTGSVVDSEMRYIVAKPR